ncbi:MAG: hypothetical protein ABSG98_05250 [Anaerolineales bacterium]|jgi:hypothetical protein
MEANASGSWDMRLFDYKIANTHIFCRRVGQRRLPLPVGPDPAIQVRGGQDGARSVPTISDSPLPNAP